MEFLISLKDKLNIFRQVFCKHKFKLKRWRIVYWCSGDLVHESIHREFSCIKCGDTKILFGMDRNPKWERRHKDKFTTKIF